MTDKKAIETAKQIVEATSKLIDYCNETSGCRNCIFNKCRSKYLDCCIGDLPIDLAIAVSNYKSKEENNDRT